MRYTTSQIAVLRRDNGIRTNTPYFYTRGDFLVFVVGWDFLGNQVRAQVNAIPDTQVTVEKLNKILGVVRAFPPAAQAIDIPGPEVKAGHKTITVKIQVGAAVPAYKPIQTTYPITLQINPIQIPLVDAVVAAVNKLTSQSIERYFDQSRRGKTLLNFGQDYQATLVNWAPAPGDTTQTSAIVKLYQPLPVDVNLRSTGWIVRELATPLLDQIFVFYTQVDVPRTYLRPPNRNVYVAGRSGAEIENATKQTLFTTGSFDKINTSDPIRDQWFVSSFEGAELNVDYADFAQFVFYSSALNRLAAFKNKLLSIEDFNRIINEQSASVAAAVSSSGLAGFTGSAVYPAIQSIVTQRNDLIQSFDGYERFLYYESNVPYSSSFSGDGGAVDELYYLADATWPKISGSVVTVASASASGWISNIEAIAMAYDIQNVNRLANNLPEYLQSDERSESFLTFVDMVGHHFDTVKLYADNMSSIYDRNSDPTEGLSSDMVWTIADSFGIDLPNQYAIENLVDYTIGAQSEVDPAVYRTSVAETWKRFLHNQMYLLKTKGTATALRGLLNVYGVLPTTVQIREAATPSFYTTASYEVFEEQTNVLELSGSYVRIPFSGTFSTPNTIQLRFATSTARSASLFNVGNNWYVDVQPTAGTYGRVAFTDGASVVQSTDALELFSGEYFHLALTRYGSTVSMSLMRADDDGDIVEQAYTSFADPGFWTAGTTLYLGSSGSSAPFIGTVDEFRMWSTPLSSSVLSLHTQYPALYNGNATTSARDELLVRLSFNKPRNLGTTPFVVNESPYVAYHTASAALLQFSASGFTNEATYPYSMNTETRTVLRYAPNVGGTQFVSNKISIADPAQYRYLNTSGSSPVLSHNKSMVVLDDKFDAIQSDTTVGFYLSTTDAINDSIIRSIGNIDIQDYIGDPSNLYDTSYPDLKALNTLYWNNYAYSYNFNTFIRFVDTLLESLFLQAKKLVPARTRLLTGIVLESPILERNKIQYTLPELDTPMWEATPVTTQPTTVSSTYDTLNTVLDTTADTMNVEGSYDTLEASPIVTPTDIIDGYFLNLDDTIDLNQDDLVQAENLTIDEDSSRRAYINFLLRRFGATSIPQIPPQYQPYFVQLLSTLRPGSTVLVNTGLNDYLDENVLVNVIYPTVDFEYVGSTTYFTQIAGKIRVPSSAVVRRNQSALTDAGTWTRGTTYRAGQFVVQTGQTGSAEFGNSIEYVCTVAPSPTAFVSNNPPALDTDNWRKMTYVSEFRWDVRVASEVNGRVELTAASAGYTPFVGYDTKHYKFFEDRRLGTLRRKRLGCKSTDIDTFDGGPAIEIIPSAGDVLVVSTGAEPIQRNNNASGPVLTVR
jgi:hypothetical protein